MKQTLFCIFAAVLLTCCNRTAPQRPSYKSGQVVAADSALLQRLDLNRHLAEEADRQLTRFAKEGYALTETGYWAKNLRAADQPLREGETVMLHIQVFLLDSTPVQDIRASVAVGKEQLPEAVNDALLQMQRGDSVSLAVPWYLAYGATGHENIPPYTNLRIELETQQ